VIFGARAVYIYAGINSIGKSKTIFPDIVKVDTVEPKNGGEFLFKNNDSTSTIKIDGERGGCLIFRDTDNSGWTQCNALNGIITCQTDTDGKCNQ